MKNNKIWSWFSPIFVFCTLVYTSSAQHYVQLTDASGYTKPASVISELNKEANRLNSILALTGGETFKLYTYGYYVHSASSNTGLQEARACAINEATNSDYFILIGTEYNNEGHFKRFDIRFILPNSGQFSCFSVAREQELNNILLREEINVEQANAPYPSPERIVKAAGDYFYLLKNCPNCATGNGDICFKSSFEGIDMKLTGLKFRKKSVTIAGNKEWTTGLHGIYDHVQKNIVIDGEEYHIPDQIYESKLQFDKGVIIDNTENEDTTMIADSIHGKVFIFKNENFANSDWDNMQNEAITLDYVECWVLLKDRNNQYWLYSRFSFGPFNNEGQSTGAARGENAGSRSVTLSPWGNALKVLGNAAINACMEACINRLTDEKINDWSTAFKSVDYLGAAWEGVSSLLPWKKTKTDEVLQAISQGFVVVINKAVKGGSSYTANEGLNDFLTAVGSSLMTQWLGPKVTGAASKFTSGILRLGQSTSNGTVKKICRKFGEFTCFIKGGCFTENTLVLSNEESKKINKFQIGDLVLSPNYLQSYNAFVSTTKDPVILENIDFTWYDYFEIDSLSWSTAKFEVRSFDNDVIEVNLARPNEWFIDRDLKYINDSCFFQLPEFGVFGFGKMVENIQKFRVEHNYNNYNNSQANRSKILNPVIGTFKRFSDNIFNVSFDNGDSLLVTDNHLLFSQLRNDYIPVSQLIIGESVLTSGEKEVKFIGSQKGDKGDFVYNVEVYRTHNYFVSSHKLDNFILAHNSCADGITDNAIAQKASKEFGEAFEEVIDEGVSKAVKSPKKLTWPELLALFKRGNDFNRKARDKYQFNEINLSDKKRLDSYIPGQKIISRKATDIDNLSDATWHKYCNELVTKYKAGKLINSKSLPAGSTLSGEYFLEIPLLTNQNASKLQRFKDIAATYGTENQAGGIKIIFLAE